MKVVIVEDEYLLAEELEDMMLTLDSSIQVVAKLDTVQDSIEWFKNNSCDLVFMDIHLTDGISFSIFDDVRVDVPVIFTTAYDYYSIKAFDVNSIAYLLKPTREEDVRKALDKYSALNINNSFDYSVIKELISKTSVKYKERFVLRMGKHQRPVSVNDISYFMADDKFLFAFLKDGKKYFCDSTLSRLESELNGDEFYRVNRKYIVSFAAVAELLSYSKSRIKLKLSPETEDDVIISASKAKEFIQWLEK